MGGGDIKMMAMVGAFLGWQGVLLTIFLGALVGSLIFVPLFSRMQEAGALRNLPFARRRGRVAGRLGDLSTGTPPISEWHDPRSTAPLWRSASSSAFRLPRRRPAAARTGDAALARAGGQPAPPVERAAGLRFRSRPAPPSGPASRCGPISCGKLRRGTAARSARGHGGGVPPVRAVARYSSIRSCSWSCTPSRSPATTTPTRPCCSAWTARTAAAPGGGGPRAGARAARPIPAARLDPHTTPERRPARRRPGDAGGAGNVRLDPRWRGDRTRRRARSSGSISRAGRAPAAAMPVFAGRRWCCGGRSSSRTWRRRVHALVAEHAACRYGAVGPPHAGLDRANSPSRAVRRGGCAGAAPVHVGS